MFDSLRSALSLKMMRMATRLFPHSVVAAHIYALPPGTTNSELDMVHKEVKRVMYNARSQISRRVESQQPIKTVGAREM